ANRPGSCTCGAASRGGGWSRISLEVDLGASTWRSVAGRTNLHPLRGESGGMANVSVSQTAPTHKAPLLPILLGVVLGLVLAVGIAVFGVASIRSGWGATLEA